LARFGFGLLGFFGFGLFGFFFGFFGSLALTPFLGGSGNWVHLVFSKS